MNDYAKTIRFYGDPFDVEQIYSCWSGDGGEPRVFERPVTPEDLVAEGFFFRESELLTIVRAHASTSIHRGWVFLCLLGFAAVGLLTSAPTMGKFASKCGESIAICGCIPTCRETIRPCRNLTGRR